MIKRVMLILAVLLVIPFVSSEILISQPESTYNLGDNLQADVTLKPSSPANDFLIIKIACANGSAEIYRNMFTLSAGEEKTVEIDSHLGKQFIGDLKGECSLDANFGGESASSQRFTISDQIDVEFGLEKARFNPGEGIVIKGLASKLNGDKVEGFAEATIQSLNASVSGIVREGEFNFSINLPSNSKAGEHSISVRVYDKDSSGSIANQGTGTENMEVSSVLNGLEIIIEELEDDGANFTFSYVVNALDQTGNEMEREVSLTIYEPGDFVHERKVINSGQEYELVVGHDKIPGFWKIETSQDEITSRKLFYVQEITEADFSLIGDVLAITNTGNTVYEKTIEIGIGPVKEIKQVSLAVGETKRFRLNAPEGTYSINVDNGDGQIELGSTLLTGRVISAEEISEGSREAITNPVVLLLAILFISLIIAYVFLRKKTGDKTQKPKAVKESHKRLFSFSKSKNTASISAVPKKISAQAIAAGQGAGRKEQAAILSLNVRNQLSSYSTQTIDKALAVASSAGAKIYLDGAFRIIVFCPSLTKENDNELVAIKVAHRISDILVDHNRRFKEKIDFGIGISGGEIITERAPSGEFKFTSVSNLVVSAKKVSQASDGGIFISEGVYRRTAGAVKNQQTSQPGIWRVTGLVDRSKYSGFMNRFRNGQNGQSGQG